jgi:hypothetical protein
MKKQFKIEPWRVMMLTAALLISALYTLKAQTKDQVTEDRGKANPAIHWPNGFSPTTADLYAHNEIIISAPVSVVFRHIQEAAKWPQWYSNSKNVVIHNSPDGLLKAGTEWDWDTFGVHIKSRINEFVLDSRIGWYGNGTGMRAYHTWYLVPEASKTHVIMEECVYGDGAKKLRRTDPAVMHRGHDLWNNTLKKISEKK